MRVGARRRSFFYAYQAQPPFAILALTPRITFENATIEYATGLYRDGDYLVIGMGIDDCFTRLVRLHLCAHVLRKLKWRGRVASGLGSMCKAMGSSGQRPWRRALRARRGGK